MTALTSGSGPGADRHSLSAIPIGHRPSPVGYRPVGFAPRPTLPLCRSGTGAVLMAAGLSRHTITFDDPALYRLIHEKRCQRMPGQGIRRAEQTKDRVYPWTMAPMIHRRRADIRSSHFSRGRFREPRRGRSAIGPPSCRPRYRICRRPARIPQESVPGRRTAMIGHQFAGRAGLFSVGITFFSAFDRVGRAPGGFSRDRLPVHRHDEPSAADRQ